MERTINTFIDIFKNGVLDSNNEIHKIRKIVIPMIQRDYAQGREDESTKRIRQKFLKEIHSGLVKSPITMDFVYGDISEQDEWILLDGQQRLTTLFLLHWYAAKKENVPEEEQLFLNNFTYEVRYSTRDFCSKIVRFCPSFKVDVSYEIKDQEWFSSEWEKDPSIKAMLVMMSDIQKEFEDVDNIWEKLNNMRISFHCLAIEKYGLTDDIYIRMNSRGEPLTKFEHFKAEFEAIMTDIDKTMSERITRKIDKEWTDLLWKFKSDSNTIDDEFINYFKFICDIICYKMNKSAIERSYDVFDLLEYYFVNNKTNILFLEKLFDCWCNTDIGAFFDNYISDKHEKNKIKYNSNNNIFYDCIKNYSDDNGRRNKGEFQLKKVPLLYSIIVYLINKETITEEQFIRRLRIINNLINNSEDDISEGMNRAKGNQMPHIIDQVKSIMKDGIINDEIKNSFNNYQIMEEKEKDEWLDKNSNRSEELFILEDHELLNGQIAIIGLENIELGEKFIKLFDKFDKTKIDRALMSIGLYGQQEKNGTKYQVGSDKISTWQTLFHKSSNKGFDNTKNILKELLDNEGEFSNDYLDKIINDYITDCTEKNEFSVRYYYVNYESFRPQRFGKYKWQPHSDTPYELISLYASKRQSSNSYNPFLCEIDNTDALSREHDGCRIIIGDKYIESKNDSYLVKNTFDDSIDQKIQIEQNAKGIDKVDRIKLFKEKYSSILS